MKLDPVLMARLEVVRCMMNVMNVMAWMSANQDSLSREAIIFLGTWGVSMAKHGHTVMNVLNDPQTIALPPGQRCIFY